MYWYVAAYEVCIEAKTRELPWLGIWLREEEKEEEEEQEEQDS